MNTFAKIEEFYTDNKVNFYTIKLEYDDSEEEEEVFSETDKFITKFEGSKYDEELNIILALIIEISQRGAKSNYFRFEEKASALPSNLNERTETVVLPNSQLRLYCIRINEEIVILCGGEVKTARTAQKCPNVVSHFRLANKVAKEIDDLLQNKSIRIKNNYLVSDDDEIGFYIN